MADEDISFRAMVDHEVGPMAYVTHSGDCGLCSGRTAPVANGIGAKLARLVRRLLVSSPIRGTSGLGHDAGARDASCPSGNVNRNTAPAGSLARCGYPSAVASTIERQIASPMPVPLGLVVQKESNRRSWAAGSSPGPESRSSEHMTRFASTGDRRQLARFIALPAHRLDGIRDQIEDHRCSWTRSAATRGNVLERRVSSFDAVSLQFAFGQRHHFENGVIDVHSRICAAALS
jgi:hypothetical protein